MMEFEFHLFRHLIWNQHMVIIIVLNRKSLLSRIIIIIITICIYMLYSLISIHQVQPVNNFYFCSGDEQQLEITINTITDIIDNALLLVRVLPHNNHFFFFCNCA